MSRDDDLPNWLSKWERNRTNGIRDEKEKIWRLLLHTNIAARQGQTHASRTSWPNCGYLFREYGQRNINPVFVSSLISGANVPDFNFWKCVFISMKYFFKRFPFKIHLIESWAWKKLYWEQKKKIFIYEWTFNHCSAYWWWVVGF